MKQDRRRVSRVSPATVSRFYVRQVFELGPGDSFYILEARRDNLDEPFGSEKVLAGLGNAGNFVTSPWISHDGLRLYYSQVSYYLGEWTNVLKMARRNAVSAEWQEGQILSELRVGASSDAYCTLAADELTILWMSRRPATYGPERIFMATRASVNLPFSAPAEVVELTEFGTQHHHLSGDGLRVYFSAHRPDNGLNNIYMMTRPSLAEPFGNIEHLDGVTGPDAGGSGPHLSPDEKTIYFHSGRGGTLDEAGIFVSYWIDDPYDVAVESIEAAIAAKQELIGAITSGLDKDRAVLAALDELGATGDIDPLYIEAAKRDVLNAIKRQMKVIAELEKAISDLQEALAEL